jgi:hypothetical protein
MSAAINVLVMLAMDIEVSFRRPRSGEYSAFPAVPSQTSPEGSRTAAWRPATPLFLTVFSRILPSFPRVAASRDSVDARSASAATAEAGSSEPSTGSEVAALGVGSIGAVVLATATAAAFTTATSVGTTLASVAGTAVGRGGSVGTALGSGVDSVTAGVGARLDSAVTRDSEVTLTQPTTTLIDTTSRAEDRLALARRGGRHGITNCTLHGRA